MSVINHPDTKHRPGINCPQCHFSIPISIEELLVEKTITCPHCHTRLVLDRSEQSSGIHLKKAENEDGQSDSAI